MSGITVLGNQIAYSAGGAIPKLFTTSHAVISVTGSGQQEVVAAVAGFRILVVQYTLIVDVDTTITWKSATDAISGAMELPAKGGLAPPFNPAGMFITAVAEALNMTIDPTTANVLGHLTYAVVQ